MSIPWKSAVDELMLMRGKGFQVSQYLGVISGLKASIDDWIQVQQLEAYGTHLRRAGLTYEIDCIFRRLPDTHKAFGTMYAPTTRAIGLPWVAEVQISPATINGNANWEDADLGTNAVRMYKPTDEAHIVVARTREAAAETLACAWYPVIVENRVMTCPHGDAIRLGDALGYPRCCVDFFIAHNNWPRQNQYAEAAKVSTSLDWRANCLAKNTQWELIFHMPCAFDCPATLTYSAALLEAVREYNEAYARRIEDELKRTVLVASERLVFALNDAQFMDNASVNYSSVESLQAMVRLRDPRHDDYYALLAAGNNLKIADGAVIVMQDGRDLGSLLAYADRGVAEVPLVLDFCGSSTRLGLN
jgi:hypothetical protein